MLIMKQVTILDAWQLGAGTDTEQALIAAGKMEKQPDGSYLIFSRETDTQGQVAWPGDYIKIDSAGFPYPNTRAYFESHHVPLGGSQYRQIVSPLKAWTIREPMCPEIRFLTERGLLRINENDAAHYFRAFLWGADLFAAKDAVIVFDSVERDETGAITAIDFHFIAWAEFLITHRILD